ncbi:ATP-binding protein [uncultured Imperialibacter sp.]|uniref:sensor histidine kinase n=1 Tax=uncultured Imperialibacter sp. TaxID=1672639 RepID=UPI0030DB19D5
MLNSNLIRGLRPKLSPSDLAALKSFLDFNKKHSLAISEALRNVLLEHPKFGQILKLQSQEDQVKENQISLQLQEEAIEKGNWDPYTEHLIEQGSTYAQMGLAFNDWFTVIAKYRELMQLFIGKEMNNNFDKVARLWDGTNKLIDYAMSVISEAYFLEKNKLIAEEQQKKDEAILQLNELNNTLEKRVQERTANLKAANDELESFSYSVSHDLRTPLRAIDGFSKVLVKNFDGQLNDTQAYYLGVIVESVGKMSRLIDDLLSFSKMGRIKKSELKFSLEELIQEGFKELMQSINPERVEISVNPLPDICADRGMIKHVVNNLLSNAVKFSSTREKTKIEIGSLSDTDNHIFYVRDNGVGFDMQYAHKLFGIFQRLHAEDEFEGTGVGLAIVKRIIQRHGGEVWAESEIERGTTMYFSIPK